MSLQVVYLPYAVPITVPKAGGGGSVEDISFDVNPDYSEDHELGGAELSFYIRLTNSSDAPSAVSLSFSGNILKASTFDTGTAQNPSYVIEPGIGNHKDIKLVRSTGAPTGKDGNGDYLNTSCTISYTLADGSVSDYSTNITVYSLVETVAEVVDYHTSVSGKSLELKFEGSLTNTGTALNNLQLATQSTTYTFTSTSSIAGVTGYAESSGTGYIRITKPNNTQIRYSNIVDFTNPSGQPRTWLYVFQYKAANNTSHQRLGDLVGTNNQPAPVKSLHSTPSGRAFIQTTNSSGSQRALDTSRNHTVNGIGGSESFNWGLNDICIFATSWDGNDLTVRWKQTGHGSGHSFANWQDLYSTAYASHGDDYASNTYDGTMNLAVLRNQNTSLRWLYFCIYDLETTGDMFDVMCNTLNI